MKCKYCNKELPQINEATKPFEILDLKESKSYYDIKLKKEKK